MVTWEGGNGTRIPGVVVVVVVTPVTVGMDRDDCIAVAPGGVPGAAGVACELVIAFLVSTTSVSAVGAVVAGVTSVICPPVAGGVTFLVSTVSAGVGAGEGVGVTCEYTTGTCVGCVKGVVLGTVVVVVRGVAVVVLCCTSSIPPCVPPPPPVAPVVGVSLVLAPSGWGALAGLCGNGGT